MKFTEGQLLIAKTISTGGFGNTFEVSDENYSSISPINQ